MKSRQRDARPLPLLFILAVCSMACSGPLPFMSGGALSGDEKPAPTTWALDEDFAVAQLETRPEDPYSVNLAYTQIDGRLYLNAGDTETNWVQHIAANPLIRLRLNDVIYTARAERVTESSEVAAFSRAWVDQSWFHRDPQELDRVWIYRLVPR